MTYLLVKLHVNGLKLLIDILAVVVRELSVREGLASLSFCRCEICNRGVGHCIERHRLRELQFILVIADLIKMDVRDLLGVEIFVEWIMGGHVPR